MRGNDMSARSSRAKAPALGFDGLISRLRQASTTGPVAPPFGLLPHGNGGWFALNTVGLGGGANPLGRFLVRRPARRPHHR